MPPKSLSGVRMSPVPGSPSSPLKQQGSSRNLEDLQVWSPTNAHLVTKQFEDLLENESDLSAQLKAMKGLVQAQRAEIEVLRTENQKFQDLVQSAEGRAAERMDAKVRAMQAKSEQQFGELMEKYQREKDARLEDNQRHQEERASLQEAERAKFDSRMTAFRASESEKIEKLMKENSSLQNSLESARQEAEAKRLDDIDRVRKECQRNNERLLQEEKSRTSRLQSMLEETKNLLEREREDFENAKLELSNSSNKTVTEKFEVVLAEEKRKNERLTRLLEEEQRRRLADLTATDEFEARLNRQTEEYLTREAELTAVRRKQLEEVERRVLDHLKKVSEESQTRIQEEEQLLRSSLQRNSQEIITKLDTFLSKSHAELKGVDRAIMETIHKQEGELQSLSAEVARLKQEHATQAEGFAAKERDWHKEASRREDGLTQELLAREKTISELRDEVERRKVDAESIREQAIVESTERLRAEHLRQLQDLRKETSMTLREQLTLKHEELHAQVAGLEREMEKRTEEFEKRLSALLQESMEEKQRLWRSEMERRHEERSAETKKLMQQMHDMSMQQNKKLEETEEKAMRKYEILLETARQQHDSETRQRVEADHARWEEKESWFQQQLHQLRKKAAEELQKRETELNQQHEAALQEHTNKMEEASREAATFFHKSVQDMQETARLREVDFSKKFNQLFEQFAEYAQSSEADLFDRIARDVDEVTLVAAERAKTLRKAFQQSDNAAKHRMLKMMSDLEVFWRKELQFCKTAQELAPDEMLRRMYSELEDLVTSIQKAQKRLSDVEEVDPFDAVDEVKTLKHKMFQTMASYEERIRQQYESTAESYREQADLMLGKMEKDLVIRKTAHTEMQRALECKHRKLRIATQKWRAEYQERMEERYNAVISDLESRIDKEVQERSKDHALRKEVEMLQHFMNSTELLDRRVSVAEEDTDSVRAKLKRRQREQEEESLKEDIVEAAGKVRKLWKALESDPLEIVKFLSRVESIVPVQEELVQVYQEEVDRLNHKIPLLEMVTKFEFFQCQLDQLISTFNSSSHLFQSVQKQRSHDREKALLFVELAQTAVQLVESIKKYEERNKESFLYHGKRFIETLQGSVVQAYGHILDTRLPDKVPDLLGSVIDDPALLAIVEFERQDKL